MIAKSENKKWIVLGILQVLILIGLVTDLALTWRLATSVDEPAERYRAANALPCPAVPTRLILENPACAQALLEAMNVSNVRIKNRVS